MRLVTIPLSHYCDRARWALDHAGIEFTEEQHLQMLHRRAVKNGGGTTVPVLFTDGTALADSRDIVAWADASADDSQRLYPRDTSMRGEIEALERGFADELGVETRLIAYHYFLTMKSAFLAYNGASAPRWQRTFARVMFPALKRLAARKVNISDATVAAAHETIGRYFDDVADRLSDGRRYLVGEQFTAADLTFAAMCAPVVLPTQYGVPLPQVAELDEEFRGVVQGLRDHPAGAYALRMYAEHRT